MRQVTISNQTKHLKSPLVADYCQSFWCKVRGLAFRLSLPPDRALLLVDAQESRLGSAIHMLGMWFDLTIVWLDTDLRVVDVRPARRWRSFLLPRKPASFVIEFAASRKDEFQIGDQLVFENA